jgi:hypothetical protein
MATDNNIVPFPALFEAEVRFYARERVKTLCSGRLHRTGQPDDLRDGRRGGGVNRAPRFAIEGQEPRVAGLDEGLGP